MSLRTVLVEQEAVGDDKLTPIDVVVAAANTTATELKEKIHALEQKQVDGKFTKQQGERYATLIDELALAMADEESRRNDAERLLQQVGLAKSHLSKVCLLCYVICSYRVCCSQRIS